MDGIKVSLDGQSFWTKPKEIEIAAICNRIGKRQEQLGSPKEIKEFSAKVSIDGCSFSPATFKNGCKNKKSFVQQQFIALDFDNKDPDHIVSFQEIKERADRYDLPVLFAYDTLSSTNHNKFRAVFLNDVSITDRKVAEAVQLAMGTLFPEADSTCYKDVSKFYLGGKERVYFDNKIPKINIESVFRNLSYYLKDKYKEKHYKEEIRKFSEKTGIALNKKGFFDVIVTDDPTEVQSGAQNADGGNAPTTIIYSKDNIKGNGAIPLKVYYRIILDNDCTRKNSAARVPSGNRSGKHNPYRASVMENMSQHCRLFREFEGGERELHHDELFGLVNNLLNVDSGERRFKAILSEYPELYSDDKVKKWERHGTYNKQHGYRPTNCNNFCPYCGECSHGINILSTVHPKRGIMEKLPDWNEEFYHLEEVQEDTYRAISEAYHAPDSRIHIIESMTAAGKTTSYVRIMKENPDDRFLIAAPTNLLKDEIYERAKKMNIKVRRTPSLEQIKDEIPHRIWKKIQHLYSSGQSLSVNTYIEKILKKEDIPCLKKYMKKRERLREYNGNIITTHRYLMNMSEKRLAEYDAVIIDEDIIFKSVIPNQCEIKKEELEELSDRITDKRISDKMKRLLKLSKSHSCIEIGSFEPDEDKGEWEIENKKFLFDIPAFCRTEKFYVRRKSEDDKLEDDTFVFLKPAVFRDMKYIMVSATANEEICRSYFGYDRVDFYKCRRAAYKGTLYQYPRKSMSRSSMAATPGIVDKLMEKFAASEEKVITFLKENIGTLHFGNTEGSNTLEGEDILVIGTPYHADFIYKLAAFYMDMDFDEDEEMEPQLVTHNGYRFRFTTYKDANLREVQFWMIESELEQAVGRARLLRNECAVHLFSNFPLSQSKMVTDFDYGTD